MTARLTQTDLEFVARRIPKDVRELMKRERVFIGGGFIRETISGGDVKDIDLFGRSKVELQMAANTLALGRGVKFHQTDNAITLLAPPRLPVQFITRWVYDQGEELMKSFDFTVCQAVMWRSPETGLFDSCVSDSFYSDLAARRLVYTFPNRNEDAGGSMMRVRKFLQRGYNIQAKSLGGVIARMATKVRWESLPSDDREHGLAMVFGGLLQEVDPLLVVDGLEPIDEREEVHTA